MRSLLTLLTLALAAATTACVRPVYLLDGDSDARPQGDGLAGGDTRPGGDAQSPPAVTVEALLALTTQCTTASTGKFATDEGGAMTVDICRLNGAFFWRADMDIACDGQPTAECNQSTDPWFSPETSFKQSDGQSLVASQLPYYLIPEPDARFDYAQQGILPGAAGVVIYDGKLCFGVFGDETDGTLGTASYAMASALGVDPDPAQGGVATGVTYFAFTGAGAVVKPIEDHQAAVLLGQQLAKQLVQDN